MLGYTFQTCSGFKIRILVDLDSKQISLIFFKDLFYLLERQRDKVKRRDKEILHPPVRAGHRLKDLGCHLLPSQVDEQGVELERVEPRFKQVLTHGMPVLQAWA